MGSIGYLYHLNIYIFLQFINNSQCKFNTALKTMIHNAYYHRVIKMQTMTRDYKNIKYFNELILARDNENTCILIIYRE